MSVEHVPARGQMSLLAPIRQWKVSAEMYCTADRVPPDRVRNHLSITECDVSGLVQFRKLNLQPPPSSRMAILAHHFRYIAIQSIYIYI